MAAGIFGYLGYDMVRQMEELQAPNPDPIGIPDAVLVRPTIIVVFDAVKDSITVVTPVRPEKGLDAKTALARAIDRIAAVVESLDRPLDKSLAELDDGPIDVPVKSNTTPDDFKAMVLKAKDYIAAGDAFQIVLAQRFEAPFTLPPFTIYRALRMVNPSPYMFYLDFSGIAGIDGPPVRLIGSSPEMHVRLENGLLAFLHPYRWDTLARIKKTQKKPCGRRYALANDLINDPKERAEHVMLVDLGRNDLGRGTPVWER